MVPTFAAVAAGTASTTRTIVVTNFDKTEKCSWIVLASKGGPSFKITTTGTVLSSSFHLHY